ncbi:MAG TPA: Gfo/Idh/MocA family oxidoreductase [Stellaceae bacterium]|nr:Gfo/Idh/MocA family oxidoreductase [Stellaceae bacterium]
MAHGIGIIGLGVMGERMLRNMGKHPAFAVAAAWDPTPAAAEKLRALAPNARFARDAADLIADERVGCLYIAAPPSVHLAYAAAAFSARKAVFCEKPLAIDLEVCRAAVARVEVEQRRAAINFPFASAPAVRAIATGLKSGELGSVQRLDIEVAFTRWPRAWQAPAAWLGRREEGGFVREVLSHFIFLTQRLLGPIVIEECRVGYPADGISAEQAIAARLTAGKVPVSLRGHVGGAIEDMNRWVLTAANGAFELHDWYSLKRRINGGWLEVDFGEGSVRERSYMAQLDALDAMLAGKPHALPSFREGLAVQECIEAMLRQP